jgi:feruloyl esterase
VDGLIVRPGECALSYAEFTCETASGRFNLTTCLSEEQVGTLRKIFSDWTDPITGEVIFQGYEVSTAFQGGAGQTLTGRYVRRKIGRCVGQVRSRRLIARPNGSGPGYYTYYVQSVTSLVVPLLAPALTINGQPISETQLIDLINQAESENPGGVIATDTNLSEFFGRGGKLLHYMGGADPLVPTNSSLDLFQRIGKTSPDAVGKSYQFYEIPGMAHCGGGPGTGNFGQADQVVTAAGGQYQSSVFDAQHDALLALRDWREKSQVPGPIVAAKYRGDDKRKGVSSAYLGDCSRWLNDAYHGLRCVGRVRKTDLPVSTVR